MFQKIVTKNGLTAPFASKKTMPMYASMSYLPFFEWIVLTVTKNAMQDFPKSIQTAQKKLEIKKNTSGNSAFENCAFIWVISLCAVGKMVIKNAKIRLFHLQFIPEQMFFLKRLVWFGFKGKINRFKEKMGLFDTL